MALTRVLRTQPATLSHLWYSSGETLSDPTDTPTVAITDATGAAIQSGNATVTGSSSGQTTFAMTGLSTLELLTVTWTATVAGVSRVETDIVEVVGGFFFTLAEGRASDTSLTSAVTYPTAALTLAQLETEQECEAICDRSFVPRYAYVTLDGSGSPDILLMHPDPDRSPADFRTLRSVSMASVVDGTYTDFTAGQLAAVTFTSDGMLRRTDGDIWSEGVDNVRVEYEYGLSTPPRDLRRASLLRFMHWAQFHKSGVPKNATSYSTADGASYRLDMPDSYKTGYPLVDGPYGRYSRRSGSGSGDTGSGVPASRTLTYEPQHFSLFHRR